MKLSGDKIRILAVAPYSGLRDIIRQTGAKRHDIYLKVVSGDNAEGLRVVQEELEHDTYDIIISRGGTAELIRNNVSLPVLEVEVTTSDILHAIKLADAYNGKSALVGFPATTQHAREMCQLLNNNMPIYTVHAPEDVHTILTKLHKDGYTLVIGDTIVSIMAVDAGLTPVLITSSQESIDKVFDQAEILGSILSRSQMEKAVLTGLLHHETSDLIAFNSYGKILFSTELDNNATALLNETLSSKMSDIISKNSVEFSKQYDNNYLTLSISADDVSDVYYASIRHTILPTSTQKNFVKVFSGSGELAKDFFFQTKVAETYFEQHPIEDTRCLRSHPVLLLGEKGTFFDSVVSFLYEQNDKFHSSFTLIDLKDCKNTNINWLLNNAYSPLFNTHSTIYFKNIDYMSTELSNELISFLGQNQIHRQNKLFFSIETANTHPEEFMQTSEICRSLLTSLSATLLNIASLRHCQNIIPNLAIFSINFLNTRYNKQIIGITPEGITQLQEYSWPDNFEQFHRIMKTLVQTSDEILISPFEVKKAIHSENVIYTPVSTGEQSIPFDLNRSLDQITLDIVKQVVANENGNQKKAAEILGISRTTIWRMLKDEV